MKRQRKPRSASTKQRPTFTVDLAEAGHRSRVWKDGVEISHEINGVELHSEANGLTTIKLTYPAVTVNGWASATPTLALERTSAAHKVLEMARFLQPPARRKRRNRKQRRFIFQRHAGDNGGIWICLGQDDKRPLIAAFVGPS